MQAADVAPSRVWQGTLRVRGHREDLLIPTVAVRHVVEGKLPVDNAAAWPPELLCSSEAMRPSADVWPLVSHAETQCYVRFVAVDEMGGEMDEPRLNQLVGVMVERQLAFQLACECGTVFLWGVPVGDSHGLLGAVRPHSMPATLPVKDEHPIEATYGAGGGVPSPSPSPSMASASTVGGGSLSSGSAVAPEEMGGGGGASTEPLHPQVQDGGERVWQGTLHVRGHRNDMAVACVAVRYAVASRAPISQDYARQWPQHMQCDSSKLKLCSSLFNEINDGGSQWYVRLAAIDAAGCEMAHAKLAQLAGVMISRQLAFEIKLAPQCAGTLYLWGMPLPPWGTSLLGVFRPQPHPHPHAHAHAHAPMHPQVPTPQAPPPPFAQ